MPAKGPYSNLIQPNEFVAPLDLNLYAQSMQYREGLAKQNLQDISNLYNSAFNIPTYGKDKEKLIEIENGLKSQLQSLNLSNLGNAETASQIRNLISQTVNSKDLQGIAERYYTYANEEKLAKDALEKGKTYISPIIDQAEEYYSSGVYKTDKRFSGSGFYDPNLTAAKNEILKNAPKIKKNVKQGNYFVSVESPDMDWVASQMQDLYSKPEVQKFMQYQFDRNHKNTDWVSVGMQTLQDRLQKAQAALQIDPTDVKAQQFIDSYPSLANNPERLAQIAKNERFNSEFQKTLTEDILAANYESFGQMDADDFALKAVDYQYNLLETQAKDLSLGASMNGWTLQEIMVDPSKRQKALVDSQSAKLAEFSNKESVKLQNKIAAKNDAVKGGFKFTDTDVITYVDKNGDVKTLQYGTFKSEVKKADPSTASSMIASALNKKNASDPQWVPLTADKVKITGTGDKRKVKINSFYGFGGESVPYDEIIDISNFTEKNTTDNLGQSNSSKPKPSLEELYFPSSKNPSIKYKTDVAYDSSQSKWYTAPIVNTQEEKDNIPKGAHFIYNGELYIQE